MTTQIISHHANNQLFATRQQAMDEIVRNGYTIESQAITMPCSFDESERLDYDLNYDDEMAIDVFVIETEDDEPMLIGYMYDVLTAPLYLIDIYESCMASDQTIKAFTREPINTLCEKEELLDEAEVELPAGYTFDGEDFIIANEIAELVTQQEGNGDYVTYLVSSQGMVTLHNWSKH